MLQFKVQGQKITRLDNKEIATDSINYLKAHFNFCEDWNEGEKVAIFRSSDVKKKEYLDENKECFVPWEVLKKCECGINCFKDTLTIYVSVYAEDEENNKRITTKEIKVEIEKSGYSEEAGSSEVPESVISHKTTEVNENSTDEQYATAKAVFNYGETKTDKTDFENFKTNFEDFKENVEITKTATGNAITIDSANAPLASLKLYGKTTQDGTPTPTEPKELKSVGDSGSFEVWVYGKNKLNGDYRTQAGNYETLLTSANTITIPKGTSVTVSVYVEATSATSVYWNEYSQVVGYKLVSIPAGKTRITYSLVTTDGIKALPGRVFLSKSPNNDGVSVTTSNAQLEFNSVATEYEEYKGQTLIMPYTLTSVGEAKDEIDLTKGVFTQQNSNKNLLNYVWTKGNALADGSGTYFYTIDQTILNWSSMLAYSTHFTQNLNASWEGLSAGQMRVSQQYIIVATSHTTMEEFGQWLTENNPKLICRLAEPIETPLSETELNDYRHLMTNKGNTTILSEATAEVDYYINKPNAQAIGNIHTQVNKDYFKLQQAIIETGGN